jgi:hypothetical protein
MAEVDPAGMTMSMSDVARLARVQRSVVSVWRTRSARTDTPFPSPVQLQPLRFDAAHIVDWLEATGRGNNETARDDLAAFAALPDASPRQERVVFDALTALLCLKALTGTSLTDLSDEELLDLADEHDPDDEFLYRELEASAGRVGLLAAHAEELASATFHVAAAFEQLLADRFRSDLPEQARTAMAGEALTLAAKLAVGLAGAAGGAGAYYDPTGGSGDLLLAILREAGETRTPDLSIGDSQKPASRLLRRRLRVHDVHRMDVDPDSTGPATATLVVQLPNPTEPTLSDGALLTMIEAMAQQLDGDRRGVVLAPSGPLCDSFADHEVEQVRADLLRVGHVRVIVRLPRGLMAMQGRQALALWVIGPADFSDSAEDRRTPLADLINRPLTDDVVQGLVTDLVAATSQAEPSSGRRYRFLRAVPTWRLLVAHRSLVEEVSTVDLLGAADGGDLLVRIEQISAGLAGEQRLPLDVGPLSSAVSLQAGRSAVMIGTMVARRRLSVLAGNRIDDADLDPDGGVRLIGVPELTGQLRSGSRVMDLMVLAARYPRVRLTQPGDVVFCTSPRPAAVVDRHGGAIVPFPARVFRIDADDPGGLVPDVLAADINAAPARARAWRRWPVRRIPPDHQHTGGQVLDLVGAVREQTERRLAQIDELARLLQDGLTSGTITPDPPRTKDVPTAAPTKGR